MAPVKIFKIAAERCHFHLLAALNATAAHEDNPEVSAHLAGTGEQLLQFLGQGGSGDVKIARYAVEKHVANTPAHQKRGMSRSPQATDDFPCQCLVCQDYMLI